MKHLVEYLQNYRMGARLTQQQMANILRISLRTYQEIERSGQIKKAETAENALKILDDEENAPISDSMAFYGHYLPTLVKHILSVIEAAMELCELQERILDKMDRMERKMNIIAADKGLGI